MREKDLNENGLADMAYKVEQDHEVQMARADLYKIAKYGIKLHEMLKGVSEEQGLEGWVQAKITKAADYLGSVYHHLDYETQFEQVSEAKKADKFEPHTMYKDGKSKKANKEQDHIDLAKKGWTHDKPKKVDIKESEKDTHCSDKCCGADVKREDCKCAPTCKHCNCNDPKVAESVKPEPKKATPDKMDVTDADKKLNTPAYKRMKAGDKRYNDKTTENESYEDYLSNKLYNALPETEKQKGVDGKACWKGYKRMGTKKKGGKTVDNCVKM